MNPNRGFPKRKWFSSESRAGKGELGGLKRRNLDEESDLLVRETMKLMEGCRACAYAILVSSSSSSSSSCSRGIGENDGGWPPGERSQSNDKRIGMGVGGRV